MEWILILLTTPQWHSSSFSEGGYKSEAACVAAAPAVLERLSKFEKAKEDSKTTANSKLYSARKWEFICAPAGKK